MIQVQARRQLKVTLKLLTLQEKINRIYSLKLKMKRKARAYKMLLILKTNRGGGPFCLAVVQDMMRRRIMETAATKLTLRLHGDKIVELGLSQDESKGPNELTHFCENGCINMATDWLT